MSNTLHKRRPFNAGSILCLIALLATANAAIGQSGVDRHSTSRRGGAQQPSSVRPPVPAPASVATPATLQQASAYAPLEEVGFDSACGCGSDCGCGAEVGCGDLIGGSGANIGLTGAPLQLYKPWFRAEYLGWWVDRADAPALVTTSPSADGVANAGRLDNANTTVLLGNAPLIDSLQSGVRFSGGFELNPQTGLAIQASHFRIDEANGHFRTDSTQFDVLGRPFENVETGSEGENAIVIAFPNLLDGNINVHSSSSLEGTEVLLARPAIDNCGSRWNFLLGWQNLRLEESLTINDFREVTDTGTGLTVGTTLDATDAFNTRTAFNGGVIGVAGERRRGRLTWEGTLKVALGGSASRATINGSSTTRVPDGLGGFTESATGNGLLTQASNIGSYERDDFAFVPELRLGASWQLTPRLRATAGYNLLYVSRVARANQIVDRQVNLSQISPSTLVGPAAPAFEWDIDGLVAQGFNFGLEARY